jgi:hypothetical protein
MKLITSIMALAILPLCAEPEQDTGSKAKTTGRLAYFIHTQLPEGLENPVTVKSAKDVVRVTLNKRLASDPVSIPGDGILRLVREEPNPEKPGEPMWITLAEARIAEGVQQALVILVPLAKPVEGRLFATRVQNLADFKGGDWMFINLTRAEIGIELGENKIAVKSGGFSIRTNRDLPDATNMEFSYNYRLPGEEDWKLLTASTAVVMPSRREICVFSTNPLNGRISYNGITFPVR